MTYQLETAQHPETLRRVAIDPVSRVEGHGKVTIACRRSEQGIRYGCTSSNSAALRNSSRAGCTGKCRSWSRPVRHLPGVASSGGPKGADVIVGAKKLTPAAEKPPPDALRPDAAIPCAALLPPLPPDLLFWF